MHPAFVFSGGQNFSGGFRPARTEEGARLIFGAHSWWCLWGRAWMLAAAQAGAGLQSCSSVLPQGAPTPGLLEEMTIPCKHCSI